MMNNIFKPHSEYKRLVTSYTKRDAVKAIFLFLICLLFCFLQGFIYISTLPIFIIRYSQVLLSIFEIIICIAFVKLSKEALTTVGITLVNLMRSSIMGIAGSFILIGIVTITEVSTGNAASLNLQQINIFILLFNFAISAVPEELFFRGYIQTRMSAFIKNEYIRSCLTALLFLSIHYPVKWVVNGYIYFNVLTFTHIIYLLLLHFGCNYIYKKTNCLWGAIIMHVIYNFTTSILVFA